MATILVQEAASYRLDEIYCYTHDRWGVRQADGYINGMFAGFDRIESGGVASKPIPAEFDVEGYFFGCEHHFVYWRRLSKGEIGIVTIPHERLHQIDRFHEGFGLQSGATHRGVTR